jgi:hypothetical protein
MNAMTRIEATAIIPFDEVRQMGQIMAQSKLFGIQNEAQAIALMLLCQSENLHPATAMRDYHLIQGRPALKADAMLARFQAAGGKVKWLAYTDEKVEAVFTHPAGDAITVEWTPQRAAKAQIKNDMHNKYPRQMLKARCISEGIRAIYPGVLSGLYAPEELQDIAPSTPAETTGPDRPEPPTATSRLRQKLAAPTVTADNSRNVSTLHTALLSGETIDGETGEIVTGIEFTLAMQEIDAAQTDADVMELVKRVKEAAPRYPDEWTEERQKLFGAAARAKRKTFTAITTEPPQA